MSETYDVCIVGAGVSGLLAARHLVANGFQVLLIDKGRGVGGRMSRRRAEQGGFDHGAQYFTARSETFKRLVEEWEKLGVVRIWSRGFCDSSDMVREDGDPRYCGVEGMSQIGKHLSAGLSIRTGIRIERVEISKNRWHLLSTEGDLFAAQGVLFTAPMPQTLALMPTILEFIPRPELQKLRQIEYDPCLAVMARLEGKSKIPSPGGLWLSGEPLAWMADNTMKGVCLGDGAAVTLHAGPEFSRRHWDSDEDLVTAELCRAGELWLGNEVVETRFHRWLYSRTRVTYPDLFYCQSVPAPLAMSGDGFGGGRVEGAALSGLAVGQALELLMKSR